MSRQYRPPRPRRVPDRCQACGENKRPAELFIYVDGNNGSITRNSPVLCETCYKSRYGSPQEIQL